jgi:hypothetical protein
MAVSLPEQMCDKYTPGKPPHMSCQSCYWPENGYPDHTQTGLEKHSINKQAYPPHAPACLFFLFMRYPADQTERLQTSNWICSQKSKVQHKITCKPLTSMILDTIMRVQEWEQGKGIRESQTRMTDRTIQPARVDNWGATQHSLVQGIQGYLIGNPRCWNCTEWSSQSCSKLI